MYGKVPPVGAEDTEPLQERLQSGFTVVIFDKRTAGSVIVTVLMLIQPTASFTVIV